MDVCDTGKYFVILLQQTLEKTETDAEPIDEDYNTCTSKQDLVIIIPVNLINIRKLHTSM